MSEDYLLFILNERSEEIGTKVFWFFPEEKEIEEAVKEYDGSYGYVVKRWGILPFA